MMLHILLNLLDRSEDASQFAIFLSPQQGGCIPCFTIEVIHRELIYDLLPLPLTWRWVLQNST